MRLTHKLAGASHKQQCHGIAKAMCLCFAALLYMKQ